MSSSHESVPLVRGPPRVWRSADVVTITQAYTEAESTLQEAEPNTAELRVYSIAYYQTQYHRQMQYWHIVEMWSRRIIGLTDYY